MIMEAMFSGEIYPYENVVSQCEEYSKAKKTIMDLMNSFQSTMSEEDYKSLMNSIIPYTQSAELR